MKAKAAVWLLNSSLMLAAGAALAAAQKPPVTAPPQVSPVNPQVTHPGVPTGHGKPDITNLKKGIIIGGAVGGAGGKFVAWGTTADLSDLTPLPGTIVPGGPATVAQPGKCAFNVTYDESNIGTAPTSPLYANKLKLIGPTDVAVNSARHLNVGETKQVDTQAYFTEGSNALMLYLDDGNAVSESNEGNNFFSIKYTLKCGGKTNPNPTPTPTPNPNGNPTGGPNKVPDITQAKGGIIIGGAVGGAGGKFVPWGGVVDLSDVDPLPGTITGERCAFNATYVETNIGTGDTAPLYTNKLKLDGATDVAINSARHLNAGETKTVTTQPYLTVGGHGLELSLDDLHQVAEGNEGNNVFSIRYRLQACHRPPTTVGNCDGQPDLVPIIPNPMNGTVAVKNVGKCPAGPSKLTLHCQKAGLVGASGGCAEIPATAAAPYHDAAFPDMVTVPVPALAPGATYNHTLAFWGALVWKPGTYAFVGKADAANTVAESNEGNNVANSSLTVP
jgi:tetrahydromethanopterin S-methyltransferase subunit D